MSLQLLAHAKQRPVVLYKTSGLKLDSLVPLTVYSWSEDSIIVNGWANISLKYVSGCIFFDVESWKISLNI